MKRENLERVEESAAPKYGVFDTQDNCWIGGNEGPKIFNELIIARIAAQVYEDQVLGTDLGGRFRAKEIPSSTWKLKDTVTLKHDTLTSLRRIEGQK